MIKITNLTNKTIDLTNKLSVKPNEYVTGDIELNSRINQLISMGLLKVSQVQNDTIKESGVTRGSIRRKQIMEQIKLGQIKSSIALDNVSNDTKSTNKKRNLKK